MTGTEIAAVITAVGGLLFGAVTQWRSLRADRRNNNKDDTSAVLTGYDDLLTHLHTELDRVQMSCREEIDKILAQHDREREVWNRERQRMNDEIDTLKAQVFALMEQMRRPPSAKTRKTDRKEDN